MSTDTPISPDLSEVSTDDLVEELSTRCSRMVLGFVLTQDGGEPRISMGFEGNQHEVRGLLEDLREYLIDDARETRESWNRESDE